MKFRKFFKDKDSLNVSLISEKRHYMDYSGIEKDKFPAPLPVLNVLDSVSPSIQSSLFAWKSRLE
jgi:transposase-like protein